MLAFYEKVCKNPIDMAENVNGLPADFVGPSLDRVERIQGALNHVAKAIQLDLADIQLDPSLLTEELREKFIYLGHSLASLSEVSVNLITDIDSTTRERTVDDAPTRATAEPSPERQDHQAAEEERQPAPAITESTTDTPRATSTRRRQARTGTSTPRTRRATQTDQREQDTTPEVMNPLYERIIDVAETPQMKLAEGARVVGVNVISDDKIKIGDREITIKGHELFLFNALVSLREQPRSAEEIRDLGFYPEGQNGTGNAQFSTSMRELSALLNTAAGVELIKKVGAGPATRYCVNPSLVLSDKREPSGVPKEDVDSIKKD